MEKANLKEVNKEFKEPKQSFWFILKDCFWNNAENVPQGGEIPKSEEQMSELRKSARETRTSDDTSKELENSLKKAEKIIKSSIPDDKMKKSKIDRKESENKKVKTQNISIEKAKKIEKERE